MTASELLLVILVCLAILMPRRFRPCPKGLFKKRRRQKFIPVKSTFRTYDNPFKPYRLQPSATIITRAEQCRAEQLRAENPAELAVKGMLDEFGVAYRYQYIIYRTGSFIVVDFLIEGKNLVIEVDGSCHIRTIGYDAGRDAWLMQAHGIRTLRIPARVAFHPGHCWPIIAAALNR